MNETAIARIREIGAHLVDPELTAQIFEELPDALVLVDSTGVIQLLNRQAEVLFGYARAELFDQRLDVLLPGPSREAHRDLLAGYFAAPRRRPMGIGLLLHGQRRDGTTFAVEISLGPIITPSATLCVAVVRVMRRVVRPADGTGA